MINNNTVDERQVFFVHGGVDTKDREKVREITEQENNAIIVASQSKDLHHSHLLKLVIIFLLQIPIL